MVANAIFVQVHTYNDTKLNFDIYIYITEWKLNNYLKVKKYVPQVLTVFSVCDSFPQSSSSFLHLSVISFICWEWSSDIFLYSSSKSLVSSSSILCCSIMTLASSISLDCEHEVKELLALLLWDFGLGAQIKTFWVVWCLSKMVSHILSLESDWEPSYWPETELPIFDSATNFFIKLQSQK